ncbi:MAG: 2-C-methyl-D-erythritol 4-phosphate cytidylyltransferase [Clostridia bacterium]|nr:2-C-methyl-D-erythritol 4-phosphate cytidylyltransferase [Clostridia bacterium]
MVFAAVLGGGVGSRMGADRPKQYLSVGGKPILVRSVEKFTCRADLACVLVLVPEEWIAETEALLAGSGVSGGDVPVVVLAGGATRNDTLRGAIDYLEEHFELDDDSVFVTHDAVRPFLTQKMIDDNIAAVREYGACGTCIPSTDTVVESADGTAISDIPDRSRLYQMQTPQSFRPLRLKALMDSLTPEEEAVLTDGCKIYLLKGEPVVMVPGAVTNIKITYPTDLAFAEAFAAEEDG